jgi:FkbM family methyltransferase
VSFAFDQWLVHALSNGPVDHLAGRVRYWLFRVIRNMRLAFSDPIVSAPMCGRRLQLPLSHELPIYRMLFPGYAANLGRLSAEVNRKYPNLTMVDVGANVGDSAAIVRTFAAHPILCVEGEPRFFQLLGENTRRMPDVELEHTFLGAAGDHIRSIKVQRGNAQILLGPAPGANPICTLSEVLARHPRFASPKLLKLDAEGFDCKILASEIQFLKQNKPVLFFEYYPHSSEMAGQDALQLFPLLSQIGYAVLLIYRNIGKYFMTLNLDNASSLEDLHFFLVDLGGFCDVTAFHEEDKDIAARVRALERAKRTNGNASPYGGIAT